MAAFASLSVRSLAWFGRKWMHGWHPEVISKRRPSSCRQCVISGASGRGFAGRALDDSIFYLLIDSSPPGLGVFTRSPLVKAKDVKGRGRSGLIVTTQPR